MIFVLLTGAGFSRNWGGWLANEAMEYLLGCVDTGLKQRLWKNRQGGFEATLAELQNEYMRSPNPITKNSVDVFMDALSRMFVAMNTGFATTTFEPSAEAGFLVRNFLVRFDAIFTLNQDLLLEQHYLDSNVSLAPTRRWLGWQMPGLKFLHPTAPYPNAAAKIAPRTPDPSMFKEKPNLQPYYKLHGSSNWHTDAGERMLIMGDNKAGSITQNPLLKWYGQKFDEYLCRPRVRLMVIGYSFSDPHINQAIMDAADKGGLELFIIDPRGVDVLDLQLPHAPMRAAGPLMNKLAPRTIGASRRPLNSIFGNDRVEFEKIARFFENTRH